MKGWDRMEARWWREISESLSSPWSKEAACFDLRWWNGQIRTGALKRRPGRGELARRWGWTDWEVRNLLRDADAWADPLLGDPGGRRPRQRASRGTRQKPPTTS